MKGGRPPNLDRKPGFDLRILVAAALFCAASMPQLLQTGPKGGAIVGGSGQISQNGLATTIQQNSSSLAINWQSYNLDQQEAVNYLQPSPSSIAQNRILDLPPSRINDMPLLDCDDTTVNSVARARCRLTDRLLNIRH